MSPDSQEFGGCIILTRSVPTKHLSSTRAVKSLSHRSRESTIGPKKVQTGKTQAICVRLWISSFCPFLNFGNRLPSALFGKNCHSRMVCGSLRQNGMACAENEFGDKAVGITRCFGMASELVAIHFVTLTTSSDRLKRNSATGECDRNLRQDCPIVSSQVIFTLGMEAIYEADHVADDGL